jgi:hypothetical protein
MTYIEIAELDKYGVNDSMECFDNVLTASHYGDSRKEAGYKERVVIEYESDDGNHIITETVESEYGVRIVHVEE